MDIIFNYSKWRILNESKDDELFSMLINDESLSIIWEKIKLKYSENNIDEFDVTCGKDGGYADIRTSEPTSSPYDDRSMWADFEHTGEGCEVIKESIKLRFNSNRNAMLNITFIWTGSSPKYAIDLFNIIVQAISLSFEDIRDSSDWMIYEDVMDAKSNTEDDISYDEFRSELDKDWKLGKRKFINNFDIIYRDNTDIKLRVAMTRATGSDIKYDLTNIDNNPIVKDIKNIRDEDDKRLKSMSDIEIRVLIDNALDASNMAEVKRLAQYLNESRNYNIHGSDYNLSHIIISSDDHQFYSHRIKSFSDALKEINDYVKYFNE
jgi:hypothetical protein